MYTINKDKSTGEINIIESYTYNKIVSDYLVLRFGRSEEIYDVSKIKSFTPMFIGVLPNMNISVEYRISRNGDSYGAWLPMLNDTKIDDLNNGSFRIENFPLINEIDRFYIDIKILKDRVDSPIELIKYNLNGRIERNLYSGEDAFTVIPGGTAVIKPPYIYKIFKLTDIEILKIGEPIIKYRFSNDNGRTVSGWEILSKENISTKRISPIRFFQIEYLIENETSSPVRINDINLIGDFQNVTLDVKTNLYGIRSDCDSLMLSIANGVSIGTTQSSGNMTGSAVGGSGYCANGSGLVPMTATERANLFNPYEQTQTVDFLNTISNDANAIFGHEVLYFLTDADSNGIDYTFHEYQLLNYVCSETIKVSVDGNSFPDNQISINQFDLSLFESFEIHITKDDFKTIFGVDKRPSKEDFLWFCTLNRMFQVEHAQPFRQFNNAAIYYKVLLKKYTQKANVGAGNKNIEERVRELTRNSTIDELFGIEMDEDKAAVANKEQFNTLTKDTLRLETSARIIKEIVESRTNVIAKTYYDLAYSTPGEEVVKYRNMKNDYKVSDNIGFYCWFNLDEYVTNDVHNLFNYHSGTSGIRIDIKDNGIVFKMNTDEYKLDFDTPLGSYTYDDMSEGKWVAYVVNVDQRNRNITQYLYRMNDVNNPSLEMVYKSTNELVIQEFYLANLHACINASDIKITNITLFNDIIPENVQVKLLSSPVIRDDSKHLVFTDNANATLVLPNYSISQEK